VDVYLGGKLVAGVCVEPGMVTAKPMGFGMDVVKIAPGCGCVCCFECCSRHCCMNGNVFVDEYYGLK